MSRLPAGEDGAGAVLVLAAALTALVAACVVVGLGGLALARHRAETAADLGALAGAQALTRGAGDGCAAAREVVRANGATLARCETYGATIDVTAVAPAPRLGWLGPSRRLAHGQARAGPPPPPPLGGTP